MSENLNSSAKDLISYINTELKRPANSFLAVLNLLENTVLDAEQSEYVQTLKESAQKMISAVSAVQDFSRIDSGEIECRTIDFDLRTTIADVQKTISGKTREKGLEFNLSVHHLVPSLLKGDPERLRQILYFLLDNSVKYTEQGQIQVLIVLGQENQTHATISFEVKDSGIGIEKDRLEKLSNAFSQTHDSEDLNGAVLGMGLSIAKQLVHLMDGAISVKSEPGQGTVFRCVIKFEKQPIESKAKIQIPRNLKNKRVLIVDGDSANRLVLKGYLKTWGCQFDEAVTAQRGLEKIKTAKKEGASFDIALIDMHLPEVTGEQLAAQIRKDERLDRVLLIMLCAMGQRGDVERLEKIGVQGYLPKPTQNELLFDALAMALAMSRSDEKQVITRHFVKENKKQQLQILCIDPGIANKKILKNILEKSGYSVEIHKTRDEAVNAFKEGGFQMVLLEEKEGGNPIETINTLRDVEKELSMKQSIILLITQDASPSEEHSQIDDYIQKPITSETLLATIEKSTHQVEQTFNPERTSHQRIGNLKKTGNVFDFEGALERAMDDGAFLKVIVEEFMSGYKEKMITINKGIKENDNKRVAQQCYSLRSSALSVGAKQISDLVFEMEKKADLGDLNEVNKSLDELENQYQRFTAHVQTIDWSQI